MKKEEEIKEQWKWAGTQETNLSGGPVDCFDEGLRISKLFCIVLHIFSSLSWFLFKDWSTKFEVFGRKGQHSLISVVYVEFGTRQIWEFNNEARQSLEIWKDTLELFQDLRWRFGMTWYHFQRTEVLRWHVGYMQNVALNISKCQSLPVFLIISCV